MQPLETTQLPGSVSHTLSILDLVGQSDIIVKLVMLLLLVASFWSWAVIFDKALRLRRLRAAAASFEETFCRAARSTTSSTASAAPGRPDECRLRRGHARMAPQRRQGLLGTAAMRDSLQQRIER